MNPEYSDQCIAERSGKNRRLPMSRTCLIAKLRRTKVSTSDSHHVMAASFLISNHESVVFQQLKTLKWFNAQQFITRRQSKDDFGQGFCSCFECVDRKQVRREGMEGSSGKEIIWESVWAGKSSYKNGMTLSFDSKKRVQLAINKLDWPIIVLYPKVVQLCQSPISCSNAKNW